VERIPSDGLDDSSIKGILRKRNVAVVGASRDLGKPAGFVPEYLKRHGYRVLPVNPFAERILGEKCYSSLSEVPAGVDVVDVFRPSPEAARVVAEAAAKGIGVVWLQEGIYSEEAERLAKGAGITLVWNRCMKKEHQRLFGADL